MQWIEFSLSVETFYSLEKRISRAQSCFFFFFPSGRFDLLWRWRRALGTVSETSFAWREIEIASPFVARNRIYVNVSLVCHVKFALFCYSNCALSFPFPCHVSFLTSDGTGTACTIKFITWPSPFYCVIRYCDTKNSPSFSFPRISGFLGTKSWWKRLLEGRCGCIGRTELRSFCYTRKKP